jgi:outer membrane protein assembly factor BamB
MLYQTSFDEYHHCSAQDVPCQLLLPPDAAPSSPVAQALRSILVCSMGVCLVLKLRAMLGIDFLLEDGSLTSRLDVISGLLPTLFPCRGSSRGARARSTKATGGTGEPAGKIEVSPVAFMRALGSPPACTPLAMMRGPCQAAAPSSRPPRRLAASSSPLAGPFVSSPGRRAWRKLRSSVRQGLVVVLLFPGLVQDTGADAPGFTVLDISTTITDYGPEAKYSGGVLGGDGAIYFVPAYQRHLGIFNPATGQFKVRDISDPITGDAPYRGGVLGNDGVIYLVPGDADSIGQYNPATGQFTVRDISSTITGSYKYRHGVLVGDGVIYFAPYNANSIGIFNPATGMFTVRDISATISIKRKYRGGVLGNDGVIYFVPYNADNIGQYNPATGQFTVRDISSAISINGKYSGGVLGADGVIYFVPSDANNIGQFNPATGQFTVRDISDTITGYGKYLHGVRGADGVIYFVPTDADNIGQYNPATGQFKVRDISSAISIDGKYQHGVLGADGVIYFVPWDANNIGIFNPAAGCFPGYFEDSGLTCTACPAGTFSAANASSCTACEAPPGSACLVGSVSPEGSACPGHLVCPGGAEMGNPVAVMVFGVVGAVLLVGSLRVAYDMLQPETCGSCNEEMSCSNPVRRVVKARAALAVLAIIIVGLLAVLAGLAVPWVSQALKGGMIEVAVLASFCAAAAVLVSCFFVFPKWINKRCCCLCQQGGNARKVHIDVEANPSVCGQCKTRYEGMHRAPAGALAYDASEASQLIAGVRAQLKLKPGFVPGLPSTQFRADNLPRGLTIDARTSTIEGTAAAAARCQATVTAANGSGECSTTVDMCVRAQVAPSGLTHESWMPAASEFSSPPHSKGLVLVGDSVSIKCKFDNAGLPAGTCRVEPALPPGLSLNSQTYEIRGTPTRATARKIYVVTLENAAGKSESTISLEVQRHTQPVTFAYASHLRIDAKIHAIFVVGKVVEMMLAGVDMANHLLFDVSPDLPAGLSLDRRTGCITGTPSTATSKVVYTITARNLQGETRTKIALAVSDDWQGSPPPEWSVEMCQKWLLEELLMSEKERYHLLKLDGSQLALLQSPEAVASKCPELQPVSRIAIAKSVTELLRKWDAPEEQPTLVQRPVGVAAGDNAKLDYLPVELRKEYVPVKVLGAGTSGVVLACDYVRLGHKKYRVAIKVVYSGAQGGFSAKASRRTCGTASRWDLRRRCDGPGAVPDTGLPLLAVSPFQQDLTSTSRWTTQCSRGTLRESLPVFRLGDVAY